MDFVGKKVPLFKCLWSEIHLVWTHPHGMTFKPKPDQRNYRKERGLKGRQLQQRRSWRKEKNNTNLIYSSASKNTLLSSSLWDELTTTVSSARRSLRGPRARVCVCMHAYISQMTITTLNRRGEQNEAVAASRCAPDSKGHLGSRWNMT